MQKSFAFNAVPTEKGFDREYDVAELLEYFADLFSGGISPFISNNLQIIANGDMSVTLHPGVLWDEKGCKYKNTSDEVINLSPADGIRDRIDRISITWKNEERIMEYTVQESEYAYNPVPPICRRNANYRDYVVADVFVKAGAVYITQANITDQRLNNELCGMAAGLLQQFDPKELFIQISKYFDEFRDRTGVSYSQFMEVMETYIEDLKKDGANSFNDFKSEIAGYISNLKAKGDADLATITQQLIDFRNTNEAKFLEWFEGIKGTFETDPGGQMDKKITELKGQVEFNQMMITTGKVLTGIATSNGDYIVDSMGNQILIGWPICKCN